LGGNNFLGSNFFLDLGLNGFDGSFDFSNEIFDVFELSVNSFDLIDMKINLLLSGNLKGEHFILLLNVNLD